MMDSAGTRRLRREADKLTAARRKGQKWSAAVRRKMSRSARRRPDFAENLARMRAKRAWKPEEEALLGTMPDAKVAKATGRPVGGVQARRQSLGIPPYPR
jgi:hypothetical protein